MSWGVVLRALGWVTGAVSLQESRRKLVAGPVLPEVWLCRGFRASCEHVL
jgi:hypothetical protein